MHDLVGAVHGNHRSSYYLYSNMANKRVDAILVSGHGENLVDGLLWHESFHGSTKGLFVEQI